MIIVRLDRMLADRKMQLNQLAEEVGVSVVNLSNLKTGKVKAIRFKATGKLAWGITIAAISTSVAAILVKTSSGGLATPITSAAIFTSAPAAIAVLGPAAAKSAILIAVAGGGVGALHALRKYEIIEQGAKLLKLKKR